MPQPKAKNQLFESKSVVLFPDQVEHFVSIVSQKRHVIMRFTHLTRFTGIGHRTYGEAIH